MPAEQQQASPQGQPQTPEGLRQTPVRPPGKERTWTEGRAVVAVLQSHPSLQLGQEDFDAGSLSRQQLVQQAPHVGHHCCCFGNPGQRCVGEHRIKAPRWKLGTHQMACVRLQVHVAVSPSQSRHPARSTPSTLQPQAAMWAVSVPSPQPRSSTRSPGWGSKSPITHGQAPGRKHPSACRTRDPNAVGQHPWGPAQVSGIAARLWFSCSAIHSMISAERLVLLPMEPMAKIGADEAATPKDIIIASENSAPTSPPNRIKAATTWQNAPALLPLELTSFDVRSPWTWLEVEPEELEGKLFSG